MRLPALTPLELDALLSRAVANDVATRHAALTHLAYYPQHVERSVPVLIAALTDPAIYEESVEREESVEFTSYMSVHVEKHPIAATARSSLYALQPSAFPIIVERQLQRQDPTTIALELLAPARLDDALLVEKLVTLAFDPARLQSAESITAARILRDQRARYRANASAFDAAVQHASTHVDLAALAKLTLESAGTQGDAVEAIQRLVLVPDCGGHGARVAALLDHPDATPNGSIDRERSAIRRKALESLFRILGAPCDLAASPTWWEPLRTLLPLLAEPAAAKHVESFAALIDTYGLEVVPFIPALVAFLAPAVCPRSLRDPQILSTLVPVIDATEKLPTSVAGFQYAWKKSHPLAARFVSATGRVAKQAVLRADLEWLRYNLDSRRRDLRWFRDRRSDAELVALQQLAEGTVQFDACSICVAAGASPYDLERLGGTAPFTQHLVNGRCTISGAIFDCDYTYEFLATGSEDEYRYHRLTQSDAARRLAWHATRK